MTFDDLYGDLDSQTKQEITYFENEVKRLQSLYHDYSGRLAVCRIELDQAKCLLKEWLDFLIWKDLYDMDYIEAKSDLIERTQEALS